MIHTPNNEEETTHHEFHSILGALQHVGDVHFQLQHATYDNVEDFTENKRRREEATSQETTLVSSGTNASRRKKRSELPQRW